MTNKTVRWAGIAGVIFVVLILITVFAGGAMPKVDASTAKIQKFYSDHRRGLLVSNFFGLLAIPFAVWFAVVLREIVRGVDRLSNALATALLVGLAVTAPMAMVGGAIQVAPAYLKHAAGAIDGNTLRLLFDTQGLAFAATAGGITIFAAASAVAIRRSAAMPAYTMWLAVLAVLGNLLTMVSVLGPKVSGLGFAGLITFGLFVLVTGITIAASKTTVTVAAP